MISLWDRITKNHAKIKKAGDSVNLLAASLRLGKSFGSKPDFGKLRPLLVSRAGLGFELDELPEDLEVGDAEPESESLLRFLWLSLSLLDCCRLSLLPRLEGVTLRCFDSDLAELFSETDLPRARLFREISG